MTFTKDAVFESQKTGPSKACETEMARAAPVVAARDAKNCCSDELATARLEPQDKYIYPPHVVALLELGYLVERNQGIFKRQNTPAERLQSKDLGQLARKCLTKTCKEKEFLAFLLAHGLLFECSGDSGIDMFWDDVVEKIEQAKLLPRRNSCWGGVRSKMIQYYQQLLSCVMCLSLAWLRFWVRYLPVTQVIGTWVFIKRPE
jgi:hypothetical protein